ncbi:MAG: YjbQ family protein [Magnetococcales bacterium]|nr:YjbQ family protein [Magnetococcales bacterium]
MRQTRTTLFFATRGPGMHDITAAIDRWLHQEQAGLGVLTLFCRHTSASLVIQENADPDVTRDLTGFLDQLVPERGMAFRHVSEGSDDMPAHVKTALTGVSLAIPVADGRMDLGAWQGVFLCEHRRHPHQRQIVAHFMGD